MRAKAWAKAAPKFKVQFHRARHSAVHIRFNRLEAVPPSRTCTSTLRPPSPPPLLLPMADSHMSSSSQTRDPSAIFTTIFEAASNEYKTLTGQDLRTNPLATELEGNNDSPDSILSVFQKQAQALDKFRKRDDKLMKSLTPIVHILCTFSATAGANIGLVRLFFSFPVL